jgi:RIO kinase 1
VGQWLPLPLARQLHENHLGRFATELLDSQYGKEIWSIYQSGKLQPDTELSGRVAQDNRPVNVGSVIREIDDVIKEEAARRRYKQAMEQ